MIDKQHADYSALKVELGDRGYDILVGGNLLDQAGEFIRPVASLQKAVIVTDSNVAPLYLSRLQASLECAGISQNSIILPAGEATKDLAHLEELTSLLLSTPVERKTMLIALGGGVIGDITGFAAAITLRGMEFIQIPTSLLAQVDSSVGGKTGINTPQGKNLIGAFHQPRLVLADISTLKTLPLREFLAGYAEVAKYGLLGNYEFFSWLENNGKKICAGDPDALRYAVLTSCEDKARVVAEDERETGNRALLNLGHTFGHSLEAQVGYGGKLLHGEAVAIGMDMAFELSSRMGLCSGQDRQRAHNHLQSVGLDLSIKSLADSTWTADALLAHMQTDKKVQDGKLTFILARAIGDTFITNDVDLNTVRSVLEDAL
ncbi:MAG: 3-dehydroquinate synthase [Rhodospirillales bacterium]